MPGGPAGVPAGAAADGRADGRADGPLGAAADRPADRRCGPFGGCARRRWAAVVVTTALLLAGCDSGMENGRSTATGGASLPAGPGDRSDGSVTAPTDPVTDSPATVAPGTDPAETVPAADRQAVAALLAAIDAGAGGSPADQQEIWLTAVHPDQITEQRACAPAAITIGLDPVETELRPDPEWIPDGGTAPPSGTVYRIPALVEVYRGAVRAGTDMTLLHVAVLDGTAHTFALCFQSN